MTDPKPLTLADVAIERDVPLAMLVAIRTVESGGNPRAMRFEPHLFKMRRPKDVLSLPRIPLLRTNATAAEQVAHVVELEKIAAERAEARAHGLVPYTPGYDHAGKPHAASSSGDETGRAAFEFARRIDSSDAVLSSSWGSYQELGAALDEVSTAHRLLDGDDRDADACVAAFDRDPASVSTALLNRWLRMHHRCCEAMRAGDFDAVVRFYNGGANPSYVVRMKRAHDAFLTGTLPL